jgi:hypothetical protein
VHLCTIAPKVYFPHKIVYNYSFTKTSKPYYSVLSITWGNGGEERCMGNREMHTIHNIYFTVPQTKNKTVIYYIYIYNAYTDEYTNTHNRFLHCCIEDFVPGLGSKPCYFPPSSLVISNI